MDAKGWNQKQLAENAEVHPTIISLMLRNSDYGARPDTLVKLATALGCSVSYLLGMDEAVAAAEAPEVYKAAGDDGLEEYRPAVELARECGLSPEDLMRLIRATTFVKS